MVIFEFKTYSKEEKEHCLSNFHVIYLYKLHNLRK